MKTLLSAPVLLLLVLACGDSDTMEHAAGQSDTVERSADQLDEWCPDMDVIRVTLGHGPDIGSGVLEQRALEMDLIVWAEVVDSDLRLAKIDGVTFDLKGEPLNYEGTSTPC